MSSAGFQELFWVGSADAGAARHPAAVLHWRLLEPLQRGTDAHFINLSFPQWFQVCERDFIYVLCVTASEEEVHEGVHAVSEDKKHKEAETKETL